MQILAEGLIVSKYSEIGTATVIVTIIARKSYLPGQIEEIL